MPQKEDLEIIKTPGIQLTIKVHFTKEKEINLSQVQEENQFKQEMLLSCCQAPTEEEELSYWNHLHLETC